MPTESRNTLNLVAGFILQEDLHQIPRDPTIGTEATVAPVGQALVDGHFAPRYLHKAAKAFKGQGVFVSSQTSFAINFDYVTGDITVSAGIGLTVGIGSPSAALTQSFTVGNPTSQQLVDLRTVQVGYAAWSVGLSVGGGIPDFAASTTSTQRVLQEAATAHTVSASLGVSFLRIGASMNLPVQQMATSGSIGNLGNPAIRAALAASGGAFAVDLAFYELRQECKK